jgi:hypothetical protein
VYYAATNPGNYIGETYQTAPESSDLPQVIQASLTAGNAGAFYSKGRGMYAGMTITFDAPALKDQGRLIAAQLPLLQEPVNGVVEIAQNPTGFPFVTANVASFGDIPINEDGLFQASPGAIVHEAREGVYIPLRFNQPVHDFTDIYARIDGVAPPPVLAYLREDDGDHSLLTFRDQDRFNVSVEGVYNFLTGVVLFRGIDPAANLSVKTRLGVEAQVGRASAAAPFQHQSPPLDREAIDFVTRFSQEEAMAYPACYNDDNDMMQVIKQFLKIGKVVGRVAGDMGVPFVGGISSFLDMIGMSPSRAIQASRRRR